MPYCIFDSKLKSLLFILILPVVFFAGSELQAVEIKKIEALFLTWQQDPLTTMTIDWHTLDEGRVPVLYYRQEGAQHWLGAVGASHPFPFSDRTIHRVELTGLMPGTTYEFRLEETPGVYNFRTMPDNLLEPLRFVAGGDTRTSKEWMDEANRQAMRFDPDFIVWGGDLAYADADPRNIDNWYEWFDSIMETLITECGRVVPIFVAIGNHEVAWLPRLERTGGLHLAEEHGWQNHDAVFFYDLFAFPKKPGYGVLDFGNYLSIIILNTDHGEPVIGPQTDWLEAILSERQHVPHVFPVYHVPAYPSVRDFDTWTSPEVREFWTPLFDEYGVKIAFEHHDHAYKRTPPIRQGAIDSLGVVYIGDGAWGVEPREVHDANATWYLEKALSVRHVIGVTIQGRHQHFLMLDNEGNLIDQYPEISVIRKNP